MEEQLVRKLRGIISAIKLGNILPKDAGAGSLFLKLKPLNLGMHDELMGEYKKVLENLTK